MSKLNKIIRFFGYIKDKPGSKQMIYRAERIMEALEEIYEYHKSKYAFELFAETVKEEVKIEITFKKADKCSANLPNIKINGVDCDNPAYDLITRLRRAIETYQMPGYDS